MKSITAKKLILLTAVVLGAVYLLPVLRVCWLRRVPRSANRRPVNLTAPVYKTPGFASLQRMLTASPTEGKSQTHLESVYFELVAQQHLECPHYQRIGDAGEGGWDVCFTAPFDIRVSKPCVAFSFGVDHIFAYDDELAERFNCRVYMFDPSMTSVTNHNRTATSWFYRVGLSSDNSVLSNGWQVRTLCSILADLGYGSSTIDILKLDIEHWEWGSFEAALRDGCLTRVKQLMFESHTSEMMHTSTNYTRLVGVFLDLFRLGFRSWRSDENPMSRYYYSHHFRTYRACCHEHYLVNTRFLDRTLL